MATSNFHNVNSSNIFAVELENDFDYDDLKCNIESEMKAHSELSKGIYFRDGGSDPYELHSFPSTVVGSLCKEFSYKDFSIEVRVSAVIRSGYYEGCNLDWSVEYILDGNEIELADISEELQYQYEYSKLNADNYESLILSKYEKFVNELTETLEKIYSDYSIKLGVTATFSNGETVYHKI
jgi:hypothetical protein